MSAVYQGFCQLGIVALNLIRPPSGESVYNVKAMLIDGRDGCVSI